MKDEEKSKEQLIKELVESRQQVSELQKKATNNELSNDLKKVLVGFIENMPNGITVQDLNHRIIYANSAFQKQIGYSRVELLGKHPSIFIGERNAVSITQDIENTVNANKNWCGEINTKCKNGITFLSEIENFPIINNGVPIAYGSIKRDITKRKQVETSLQLSEERFYKVFNSSPLAMCIISLPDRRFLYINDNSEKFNGYQRNELIGRTAQELNLWVNLDDVAKIKQLFAEQGFVRNLEIVSRMKSGELRTGLFTSEYINFDGEQCMITVINDITERKQTEDSLRSSEERFYKVFNNSPLPMSIHSFPDWRFFYANDSVKKFNGYHREECIGRTPQELNLLVNPEDETKITQILNEQGFVRNLEVLCRMKSGELRIGLFSADLINFDNQQCILNVITDITDLKKFEKEIFRLDRLNLIGEMAAGIGHEVRNPMTTVRGFLQLLGAKEDCFIYKEYYDLMIGELDRANSIISEFLSLAKSKVIEFELKDINVILESLLPLIQADAMKNDIFLNVKLGQTQDLSLNEKQIRQLILNLVRNGMEAMSQGGNLTIQTFADNDAVILSVHDQGNGIENDVLEKLGTPFFTTKETGTGLGLAVCYSIAARHNAKIEIESNSSGTTFFVRFYQIKQSVGEFNIASKPKYDKSLLNDFIS